MAEANTSNMEILQYLYDHRPADPKTNILEAAVGTGNLEIVRWLYERSDCGEGEMMLVAIGIQDMDTIKWVHDNCRDQRSARGLIDTAAQFSLEVVRFLHEHGYEGCTSAAMDAHRLIWTMLHSLGT